jgi:hypothetical protein
MSFLTKDNSDLLYDVIKEYINIDYPSFNKRFLEFGKTNGNKMSLIEMNKKFISSFLSSTQNTMTNNVPFRPQGSRSKNVSFDEQLELHKQHFNQFSSPPPPNTPVFKDENNESFVNLDLLMKKALNERNYDQLPTQPVRKLHIGSVIEDEIHDNDVIDVEKFNEINKSKNIHVGSEVISVTNTFFSKLQQLKPEKRLDPLENPNKIEVEEDNIKSMITDLTNTLNNLKQEIEIMKEKINKIFNNSNNSTD